MQKNHRFFTILILAVSVLFISFAKAGNQSSLVKSLNDTVATDSSALVIRSSLSDILYNNLELQNLGLSKEALEYAVRGYEKLDSAGKVANPVLSIVDFSQHSRKKRLYILDMKEQKVLWNTFVSHGKNTGVDVAKNFSNRINSEQSSLGFFVTTSTYFGKHGLSLRLSGQEEGFNDNAEARGIVVHGAAYVNAARVNSDYMGRSQGCPAVPENEYKDVINIIKDGSVMFIYHPSENYLQSSELLN